MDTILLTALAAAIVILVFYIQVLHERIGELEDDLAQAERQLSNQQERTDKLNMRIDNHSETVAAMTREMELLEQQNNWLRHKRSGRNAPVMRAHRAPGVYGHRGHGA